jgi:hypothetical protein
MQGRKRPPGLRISPAAPRGVVLVATLLVMTFLTLLGVSFLSLAVTESTISRNLVNAAQAFGVAEAGLEHARVELLGADVTALLAGSGTVTFTGYGPTVSFAGGTYRASVRNNTAALGAFAADPGGASTDTDGRLLVTATGTYRTAQKVLEALVARPLFPAPRAALTLYGPNATTKIQVKTGSSAELDGHNYEPPAAWPCSGAHCNGTANSSVPAIAGALANTTQFSAGGHIYGHPASTTDLTATATAWRMLADTLAPAADLTLSGTQTVAANTVWGTPAQPVVVYLTGSATDAVTITGTVNGVGVLLIQSNLKIAGTLNFQGIVIIMQHGSLDVELTGNSSLYGQVIADCAGSTVQFVLNGNAQLRYSQAAIDRARKAAPARVLAWREVPS